MKLGKFMKACDLCPIPVKVWNVKDSESDEAKPLYEGQLFNIPKKYKDWYLKEDFRRMAPVEYRQDPVHFSILIGKDKD